ncbi:DUF7146 domain-containing protein, partial [Elioraea sp.]|uniref:DUF7146 domain-containing protein n=1 Tax=Elioraea sp. TaxID=2185103 RepID=UPI003F6E51F9
MSLAAGIAEQLAGRIIDLAPALLPGGRREGDEWRCGSVAGEPGSSLAVQLRGPRRGLWCEHAGGQGGDALDLVGAVLFNGDLRQAVTWSRQWLGLDGAPGREPLALPARPAVVRPDPDPTGAQAAEQRRRTAVQLFLEARPQLAGTPAEHYLAARAIDLRALGRQPRALRFHPALRCREAGRPLPAMVAAISDADGQHIATHRTWLAVDPQTGRWGKAPLAHPRKVLGSFAGGSIRLWRGASGRPLRDAPPGDRCILCEGIEDGLTLALACPDYRVLVAVAVENLRKLVLPPALAELVIAADNDAEDSPA